MVQSKLLKEIGKQITIARLRAHHSQWMLNRMCGFFEPKSARDNHIAKLEKGELNITLESLELIAKKCGCKIEIRLRYDRKPDTVHVVEEGVLYPAIVEKTTTT